MNEQSNPLLSIGAVPRFDAIKPEHIAPAVEQLIKDCEQAIAKATSPDMVADYDEVARILDVPMQAIGESWALVSHLLSVKNTPELRTAFAAALPRVTELSTRISSDLRLFDLYRRIAEDALGQLSVPQKKALADSLLGFKLAGAELPDDAKSRFAATQLRSAELSRDFSNHLQDATDGYAYMARAEELAGVPPDVMSAMRSAARVDGCEEGAFKVTLQMPCFVPVMKYAHNRKLREALYHAQVTRASEFGPSELDNGPVIREMLALRQERAVLLGHKNHAEVSLATKMAESPELVQKFLRDLASRGRASAEAELNELREFARDNLGLFSLQAWDVGYASEKLRQERYSFSDEEVKQYFNLEKVLAGLFEIAQTLFDIQITTESQPAWHADVTGYRVEREGKLLGRFLIDPYARPGKQGGAWMNGALPRWRRPDGELRHGVAYLVTNFAAPVDGKTSFMDHSDVVTLFHEFGHGLHFMLSTVDVPGVSGISGVEWDAVELPSQLMENFAWEWKILQRISAHAETGEPLPRDLFDKMCAARNFQGGLKLLRNIEMGLFDIRAHAEPGCHDSIQSLADEVRAEVSLMPPPSYNRFENGFAHVFAGGYAAGYYSYLWAEVLAADAWGIFEKAGVLDAAIGARYREAILERGGSRPMGENFRDFVGRDPMVDALLRQRGLACAV